MLPKPTIPSNVKPVQCPLLPELVPPLPPQEEPEAFELQEELEYTNQPGYAECRQLTLV